MMRRHTGFALMAAALGIFFFTVYLRYGGHPLIFSDAQMLDALWNSYKAEYVEPGTYRTIDRQRGDITTSEGQSYTMLRAVWMGDKETFDGAWKWTQENLGRPDDELFSWLFGKRADGTYGVIEEQGGTTSATDADTDIALALVFAYSRWQDEKYLEAAHAISTDIWEKNVVEINGTPYLLANDQEKTIQKRDLVVNPSYFAPYAYRIFAHVDPAHPWRALVDSSYDVLARSSALPLDAATSSGLPPDWIVIDRMNGDIRAAGGSLTTNYGYDAMRVPWRIALDWKWFEEPRAHAYLQSMQPLGETWKREQKLPAVFSHDGRIAESRETPAAYGGAIGYFLVTQPSLARDVYERKLETLYNPDNYEWVVPLSYYDDNWSWFGIALATNSLANLAASRCPLILEPSSECFKLASTTAP